MKTKILKRLNELLEREQDRPSFIVNMMGIDEKIKQEGVVNGILQAIREVEGVEDDS